ncbi:MAG TPA: ABC transporter substrate-binding protein [Clostridia bacterium]|nr:ABC transporter substrate-binding protein [Clostridia bacterium]
MKKLVALLLVLAMVFAMAACGATPAATEEDKTTEEAAGHSGETLVVQVWGGTYEETLRNYVIPMFEEKTGATVEVVSGAAPLSQLATEGNNASVDVLHLDCSEVVQGTKMGVLETLDFKNLANSADLYKEAFMYDNAVVTNWGTYGIVYRADLVKEAPTSWLDLWNGAYAGGKIGVIDYSMGGGLEFAEAVSRIQGTVISDASNWDKLFEKLASLKGNIGVYASKHSDIESVLSSGDIVMSVETNGRAISLMKEGYDISFCQPKEGSIAMTSLAGIASGSTHKELAYIFLNMLLSPEGQKAYAENNYYAPSNSKTVIAEELQDYMPYGQEEVSKLLYMDTEALEPIKANFIERWDKEFK